LLTDRQTDFGDSALTLFVVKPQHRASPLHLKFTNKLTPIGKLMTASFVAFEDVNVMACKVVLPLAPNASTRFYLRKALIVFFEEVGVMFSDSGRERFCGNSPIQRLHGTENHWRLAQSLLHSSGKGRPGHLASGHSVHRSRMNPVSCNRIAQASLSGCNALWNSS
jgi:hypothetical protein